MASRGARCWNTRRAVGLVTLATVVYYRSGRIALAAVSDERARAAFGVASGIAFGLLMLPNAITTALLPRLATEADRRGVVKCTRRVLRLDGGTCGSRRDCERRRGALGAARRGSGTTTTKRARLVVLTSGSRSSQRAAWIGTALLSVGHVRVLGLAGGRVARRQPPMHRDPRARRRSGGRRLCDPGLRAGGASSCSYTLRAEPCRGARSARTLGAIAHRTYNRYSVAIARSTSRAYVPISKALPMPDGPSR